MKKFIGRAAAICMIFALTACSSLDVVGKDAVRAFGEIYQALPGEEYEPHRFRLAAPDGSAWFAYDNTGATLAVDAAPFVDAGLDVSKLDNAGEHNLNPGKISIYFDTPGGDMLNQNIKDDPIEQFRVIPDFRELLGYHTALDHYGIKLGGGNMFEWAKDMKNSGYDNSRQDKDIVFVLNPDPLIAAGVDPEKVDGWSYAQVSVEENGRPAQVWRFLKPFDLR